jgi:MraZ protein
MGNQPRFRARRADPGPSVTLCFEGLPKSRLTPKGVWQYRPGIGSGWPDHCLLVYPLPDWEELERKLVRLPSMNKIARNIVRIMVGYATEVDMDGSGRVLVSRELRDFAGLKKQAMLIGQGNKFELWDEESWNEKRDAWLSEEDDGEMPADLESISF